MTLLEMWDRDRDAYRNTLSAFVELHARAMEPMRDRFQNVVAQGPAVWLKSALARIDGLPSLQGAPQASRVGAEATPKYGMCGILRPLDLSVPV
jgi:hypothetical protein